ncbi:MAG: cobalt-precorrin-7 (C5)-methyltransferase [Thermoanaerobacter sp.]|nr:cobalt-precorrin-7 (C5)-methyltransferase [Thermoanaerobacter sp.]
MAKIDVVGIGPGGKDYLTPAALKAVKEAGVLAGGERNLALFEGHQGERFVIKNNLSELVNYINTKKNDSKVAVLASGDPGMYGILSYLRKHFKPEELNVIPGISAVQYACARLAMPWQDAAVVSTHGRDRGNFIEMVRRKSKVVALAGPGEAPPELARALINAGVGDKKVYICSDLSYPAEEIKACTLDGLAGQKESWNKKNYVMVIVDE